MASASTAIDGGTDVLPSRRGENTDVHDLEKRKIALIHAHLTTVYAFLRRLGLSRADAEDAGQEVFITAVRRIEAIYEGQEKSFLFGVAVRVASRRRRAEKSFSSRAVALDPEAHVGTAPSSEEILERQEALAMLDRVLGTLSDEMRTVFVLYEIEEMTLAEIAALLDAPIGTVASRLRRGREQFQKATRRLQGQEP